MKWLLIGTLLGSMLSSSHETREECEGRAVMLREKGAFVKCVEAVSSITLDGSITFGGQ